MNHREEFTLKIRTTTLSLLAMLTILAGTSVAAAATVPEPFRGHDPNSILKINYDDLDMVLRTMVVDVGRSNREVLAPMQAATGTRVKNKVKRSTANEGNRFYFEEFDSNEEFAEALEGIRISLEDVPAGLPLDRFNRSEQLAYWLNLYNVSLLHEIIQIYPNRNLKKELFGRKSILDEKILNVAGVPLSLNDIQHTILAENYDNDPRIMYGLYQGVIGGPNLRKRAYTGENVWRYLEDNAEEFINSNRGTYSRSGDFEVSTLYEINKAAFPNFQADLRAHLLQYIQGPERLDLLAAEELEPDVDDWTIADVYGTYRDFGGSFTDSHAALMDAVISTQPDGTGGTMTTNFSAAFSSVMSKAPRPTEFSPEVEALLREIQTREAASNLLKQGRVTVEELGTSPSSSGTEEPEDDDRL